jgi:predicted DNA-binding transcriptional regulator
MDNLKEINELQDIIATSTIRAYNSGIMEERKRITSELNRELDALKQYGRTELWGLHKALMIVNQQREEKE